MFNEFPDTVEIDIRTPVNDAISWLLDTFGGVFDFIAMVIREVLLNLEDALTWLPWPAVLLLVGVLAWYGTRSILNTVVLVGLMLMIGMFGYYDLAMITLAIIIAAVLISFVIGLPIGVLAAQSDKADAVIRPLLDGAQTMPAFVYLIPAMMFFGLGRVPAVIATVTYAVPPLIRLTNLGIRTVAQSAVEAATAYGATPRQVLRDVELPLALPTIMAGVNQTTMMALAMVVIASMIGAEGLGQEVLLSINRIDPGRGFEAGLCIVALAVIIDRVTQGFADQYKESIS
ncbi:MAG: proline/glycine betaine ABC transporter permease [Thermomicrobiaceae bacterium]